VSASGVAARAVEVTGVVAELLPRALYRVAVDGHRDVIAHAGGGVERNFVRLIVGDRVAIELSAHDLGRGRIVRRLAAQGIR
jgi:translation initiation factor IF-1